MKGLHVNTIKTKLMLVIAIVTVIILASVSYLNYSKASNVLMDELWNSAANSAAYNAQIVDQWLHGIVSEVEDLAENDQVKSVNSEEYLPFLKRIQGKHSEFELLYASDINGDSAGTNDTTFNITDREYFQKLMQTGKPVVSDPIVSKATGNDIIVVVAPVFGEDETTPNGLVGACVTIDYLSKLVKDMKISGHGYGFIQNQDMVTIAHPDNKWIGNSDLAGAGDKQLTELINRMTKEKKGYGAYSYDGVEKMLAFGQVETTGWAIAQSTNMSDVMSPLGTIRSANIGIAVVAMLIMLGIAFLIANFISKPLIKLSRVAEAVAQGNLTRKVDTGRTSNDEIGNLAASFQIMIENLKSMIANIRESSEKLASHSQELASSSEEVSATVEEVAGTTNEVAATSSQSAEKAENAARESEQVRQVAEEGNRAVKETVDKINSIATSSENVSMAVQKLGRQSEQIGEIIDTITNIADQTNLLALNAAIEAARAGEHGRGFAVVAEEVRKLAEQSAHAAHEITDLIKEIQTGVGEAISAMDHGAGEVNEGVQVANNAGAALEQIIKAVENNTAVIKGVTTGIEQANGGMQELSAANEQITSTVQQVSGAAQELANIAGELQSTIEKFKVENVSKTQEN